MTHTWIYNSGVPISKNAKHKNGVCLEFCVAVGFMAVSFEETLKFGMTLDHMNLKILYEMLFIM
jgi:hypothetical protein